MVRWFSTALYRIGRARSRNVPKKTEGRLRALFDAGALAGRSDADSFFVRCDAGTHTQADLDAGRAVLQVGVAPAVPAEFIVFRLLRHGADEPRIEVV